MNITTDNQGNVSVPSTVVYTPYQLCDMKKASDAKIQQINREIAILQTELGVEQTNNNNIQGWVDQSNQAMQGQ